MPLELNTKKVLGWGEGGDRGDESGWGEGGIWDYGALSITKYNLLPRQHTRILLISLFYRDVA